MYFGLIIALRLIVLLTWRCDFVVLLCLDFLVWVIFGLFLFFGFDFGFDLVCGLILTCVFGLVACFWFKRLVGLGYGLI